MQHLETKRCQACDGLSQALNVAEAEKLLQQIHADWSILEKPAAISRRFEFRNYHHCCAFIQAATYVAHREDHHPEITFGYNYCEIRYWTHAVDGLTENDFICAAKTDQLVAEPE